MKRVVLLLGLLCACYWACFSQAPVLHIHIVSHNEPNENLQNNLNYQQAKTKLLQMAALIQSRNARWNLQTSDGLVYGARADQQNTNTNIFKTLATAPYDTCVEIDPRNKNFNGRNIADQYLLLDSLGAKPTLTVGGFVYAVCPPNPASLIDWWPYTDTVTGLVHGNKVKFRLLSGAGSLAPHCNDLNDFGIFKPDTVNNFYQHNPARNLWCVGTGCAPVLDSTDDEMAIFQQIRAQADSIHNGLWPSNKFYVTRIMTNQRSWGPLFFQKLGRLIDSLNTLPAGRIRWATIGECFSAFQQWQISSGLDHSQWNCDHAPVGLANQEKKDDVHVWPNPARQSLKVSFPDAALHRVNLQELSGRNLASYEVMQEAEIDLNHFPPGLYILRIDGRTVKKVMRE